jgi:hypothetical protein
LKSKLLLEAATGRELLHAVATSWEGTLGATASANKRFDGRGRILFAVSFGLFALANEARVAIFVEVVTSTLVAAALANLFSRPRRLTRDGHLLELSEINAMV